MNPQPSPQSGGSTAKCCPCGQPVIKHGVCMLHWHCAPSDLKAKLSFGAPKYRAKNLAVLSQWVKSLSPKP